MTTPAIVRSAAALLAAAFLALPYAAADVTKATYTDATHFDFRLIHMPDFDQRRTALPNNGSNFCVPTSHLNIMGYCANHGFPMVFPGPHVWQDQANYVLVSNAINLTGANMGTDPDSGTNNAGWVAGAEAMLLLGGRDQLTTSFFGGTASVRPRLVDLAKDACNGAIVGVGYRRYSIVGTDRGGFPILSNGSGHATTLVRCHRDGEFASLSVSDPADSNDGLDQQSAFTLREVECVDGWIRLGAGPLSLATILDPLLGATKMRIIANEMVVRPKQGYSFTNTGLLSSIVLQRPFLLPGNGTPGVSSLPWIGGSGALLDAVPTWSGGGMIVIEKQPDGSGRLREWSPVGGASPIDDGIDARVLCVGRQHQLYVADAAGKLYCLDAANGYVLVAATSNAPPVTAMAFDDESDELLILSVPLRRIARFGTSLAGAPVNFTVPAAVPMSGHGFIAAEPGTPLLWFTTDASNGIYGVAFGSTSVSSIFDAAVTAPQGISFDDLGHLFVSRSQGGSRTMLELENIRGEWAPRAGSAFTGMACGGRCEITRSRSDRDPANEEPFDPALDPDETAMGVERSPCDADLNGSGAVDAADLAILLGQWGGASTLADVDGNGTVDAGDLALMLGAWGSC